MSDNVDASRLEIGFCKESPLALQSRKKSLLLWQNCFDKLVRERSMSRCSPVESIAELIRLNFDTINPKSRTDRGSIFEFCVLDGLFRAGVDEARIMTQESVATGVNVDLCVRPTCCGGKTFFVPCKTSCRERWKQWGFEASVIKHYSGRKYSPYRIVGIFYSEDNTNPKPNISLAIKHQEKWREQCIFVDEVITVLDTVRMGQFLREVSSQ